jgi:carbamoyl-phosphate synthase large subunit
MAAPFNILFSCVGRRVVLVREFRRALESLGLEGKLVGTDVSAGAAGLSVADHAEIMPAANTLHYIPALRKLVEKYSIRLIVPLADLDLRTLSRHAAEFAQTGCHVMVGPEKVIADIRDKVAFNEIVKRAGLRAIRSFDLPGFRRQPFYPAFAKPLNSSPAVGSGRVGSEKELNAHIAAFGPRLLVQDYVPGQEFTIDVFCRRDGVVCAAVPRQRLMIRSGEVEKSLTVNDPSLIDAAVKLVAQLPGMWGVFNIQCRRPIGGQPHFFEVNARFGGGAPLSIQAGVDLPRMLIMEVLGQKVQPMLGCFTDKLLMMRYDDAIFSPIDQPGDLPGYKEPIGR